MTRSLRLPVAALAVLALLSLPALAQAPKKADVVGTWTGTAVIDDGGNTVDLILVIDKAEGGYAVAEFVGRCISNLLGVFLGCVVCLYARPAARESGGA